MTITIQQIFGEQMLEAVYALTQYAFHSSPPFQDKEEWLSVVRERKGVTCFAAREEDEIVSVVSGIDLTQNIRGKLFPVSGIWGVSTHPSARRKGLVKKSLTQLLSAERDAGKVFSALYPFRESFYERMGYVSFPLGKIAKFSPAALAPLLKVESAGKAEQMLIGPGYPTYRDYLIELRKTQHGMAVFDYGNQVSANRNNTWIIFARFDQQIEGVMLYQLKGDEATRFTFVASRFYYHTTRARYLLLDWIARHVDQADRAEIWLSPAETPELWLSDLKMKVESTPDMPMARVLDIERMGGMEVGEGNITIKVTDPLCPWNEGAWQLRAQDGKLVVSKASPADLTLTIQGLTGLIMGTHAPECFSFREWGRPDAEQCAVLRRLFPGTIPHIHEAF